MTMSYWKKLNHVGAKKNAPSKFRLPPEACNGGGKEDTFPRELKKIDKKQVKEKEKDPADQQRHNYLGLYDVESEPFQIAEKSSTFDMISVRQGISKIRALRDQREEEERRKVMEEKEEERLNNREKPIVRDPAPENSDRLLPVETYRNSSSSYHVYLPQNNGHFNQKKYNNNDRNNFKPRGGPSYKENQKYADNGHFSNPGPSNRVFPIEKIEKLPTNEERKAENAEQNDETTHLVSTGIAQIRRLAKEKETQENALKLALEMKKEVELNDSHDTSVAEVYQPEDEMEFISCEEYRATLPRPQRGHRKFFGRGNRGRGRGDRGFFSGRGDRGSKFRPFSERGGRGAFSNRGESNRGYTKQRNEKGPTKEERETEKAKKSEEMKISVDEGVAAMRKQAKEREASGKAAKEEHNAEAHSAKVHQPKDDSGLLLIEKYCSETQKRPNVDEDELSVEAYRSTLGRPQRGTNFVGRGGCGSFSRGGPSNRGQERKEEALKKPVEKPLTKEEREAQIAKKEEELQRLVSEGVAEMRKLTEARRAQEKAEQLGLSDPAELIEVEKNVELQSLDESDSESLASIEENSENRPEGTRPLTKSENYDFIDLMYGEIHVQPINCEPAVDGLLLTSSPVNCNFNWCITENSLFARDVATFITRKKNDAFCLIDEIGNRLIDVVDNGRRDFLIESHPRTERDLSVQVTIGSKADELPELNFWENTCLCPIVLDGQKVSASKTGSSTVLYPYVIAQAVLKLILKGHKVLVVLPARFESELTEKAATIDEPSVLEKLLQLDLLVFSDDLAEILLPETAVITSLADEELQEKTEGKEDDCTAETQLSLNEQLSLVLELTEFVYMEPIYQRGIEAFLRFLHMEGLFKEKFDTFLSRYPPFPAPEQAEIHQEFELKMSSSTDKDE